MLTLLCLLGSCDDKLEVQQAYEEITHRRQGGGQRAGSGYNGGAQQQTDGRTKDSFHYLISPIPTKTAHGKAARPVVSEMIPDENIVTLFLGGGY